MNEDTIVPPTSAELLRARSLIEEAETLGHDLAAYVRHQLTEALKKRSYDTYGESAFKSVEGREEFALRARLAFTNNLQWPN